MKLRVFEAFSGYGSQSIALRNLGIPYEVVAISEIDKYAIKAYEAIHGSTLNLGDISKIDPKDIPEHDLFTYSFPCQDLSVAGKQSGLIKGQTRSGLLYECEKVIEHRRPKYLLLENVKNLVGKKFKPQFDEWLNYLEGLGYTNYWQVLNAKHYGVPQNRERVFVVSILGEHKPFEFPKPIPLDKRIKDILEDGVDEKYYINKPFKLADKIDPTLTTMQGGHREPKILCEGNIYPSGGQNGNIYNTEGISPTINAGIGVKGNGIGSNNAPKILEYKIYQNVKVRKYEVDINELKKTLKIAKNKSGLTIKDISCKLGVNKTTVEHWFRSDDCFSIPDENIWLDLKALLNIQTDEFDKSIIEFEIKPNEYDMSNRVYGEQGIAPTLTATGESGAKKIILIPQATKKGYIEMEVPGICDLSYPDSKTRRGRVQEDGKVCPTLTASSQDICYVELPLEKEIKVDENIRPSVRKNFEREKYDIANSSKGIYRCKCESGWQDNQVGIKYAPTLRVSNSDTFVYSDFRIRKLTPRECFRLMGMKEDDIDKIQEAGISNTQQYKMAGNSIVVDVLEAIFKNLYL